MSILVPVAIHRFGYRYLLGWPVFLATNVLEIFSNVVLVGFCWYAADGTSLCWRRLFVSSRRSLRLLDFGIALVLLTWVWQVAIRLVIGLDDPLKAQHAHEQLLALDSPNNLSILTLVSTVLVTPLAEEVFFRGFLLNCLCIRWSFSVAVIVVSTVFALIHLMAGQPPATFPYLFFLSLITCAFYAWSRSLWPPIAFHVAINLLASAPEFSKFITVPFAFLHGLLYESGAGMWPGIIFVETITVCVVILWLRRLWPAADLRCPYDDGRPTGSADCQPIGSTS